MSNPGPSQPRWEDPNYLMPIPTPEPLLKCEHLGIGHHKHQYYSLPPLAHQSFTNGPEVDSLGMPVPGIPEHDWYQMSTPDEHPGISNTHTVEHTDIQSLTSLTRVTLLKTKTSGRVPSRGLLPEISACLATHVNHQRFHSDTSPMPGNNDHDSFDAANMMVPRSNMWNVEKIGSSFENVFTVPILKTSHNVYNDGQARPRRTKRVRETDVDDQDRIPRRCGPFRDQQTRDSKAVTNFPNPCIRCRIQRKRVSFLKYVHLDLSMIRFFLTVRPTTRRSLWAMYTMSAS